MTRVALEGGCFVTAVTQLDYEEHDDWHEAVVASVNTGSHALSQYHVRVLGDRSPGRRYPNSDSVVYIRSGRGVLTIGSRSFKIGPESGAWIAPGEGLNITPEAGGLVEMLVTVCPECDDPKWFEDGPAWFDIRNPERVVSLEEQTTQPSEGRNFQRMVDDRVGSDQMTQFMAEIPLSKAPSHEHDYEELICILSGHGRMWAGDAHTPIRPGSLIFLPRETRHHVECTDEEGMQYVAHRYPAGEPAVREREDPTEIRTQPG